MVHTEGLAKIHRGVERGNRAIQWIAIAVPCAYFWIAGAGNGNGNGNARNRTEGAAATVECVMRHSIERDLSTINQPELWAELGCVAVAVAVAVCRRCYRCCALSSSRMAGSQNACKLLVHCVTRSQRAATTAGSQLPRKKKKKRQGVGCATSYCNYCSLDRSQKALAASAFAKSSQREVNSSTMSNPMSL